jgi:CO/xanthine dehydrogenase FAD-binding subunit
VLAGGTDFMVEVNAGRRRPEKVLSLRRLPELRARERSDTAAGATIRLGAAVTYTDLLGPALASLLPALAHAARTVGSPQIRNAGTIGGNLATASPAGDTLPVLAALDAVIEVAGPAGRRELTVAEFITGPKRNALNSGELIVSVRLPVVEGHQEFRKIGVRNAMVIAVASLALVVDTRNRTLRCALGSVGPGPIRATEAEAWLGEAPRAPTCPTSAEWSRMPPGPSMTTAAPLPTGATRSVSWRSGPQHRRWPRWARVRRPAWPRDHPLLPNGQWSPP